MNIYVGNISKTTKEESIRAAFAVFGQVGEVKLIRDKHTHENRGFGFVEMPAKPEAIEAIKKMNQSKLDGNQLIVNEAAERKKSNSFQWGSGRS
ncbi:MAG: RNA-binding protein [Calditrichaeota bacterium]|nr:MAG: RNA-binding protein [Calditrichota bacterium]MBL1206481.1 RNA-binding protein [Calditrichota bacterium]NOG46308.1 RNA-binding protein [Calditrichota bacterium]